MRRFLSGGWKHFGGRHVDRPIGYSVFVLQSIVLDDWIERDRGNRNCDSGSFERDFRTALDRLQVGEFSRHDCGGVGVIAAAGGDRQPQIGIGGTLVFAAHTCSEDCG
jgi:hypothetical protein